MTRYIVLCTAMLIFAAATTMQFAAATMGDNACSTHLHDLAREAKLGEDLFWQFSVVGDTVEKGLLSYSLLSGPKRQPSAMALIGAPTNGKRCNAAQVAVNYDARSCESFLKDSAPDLRVDYTSDNAVVLSRSSLQATSITLLRAGSGCVLVVQHATSK